MWLMLVVSSHTGMLMGTSYGMTLVWDYEWKEDQYREMCGMT